MEYNLSQNRKSGRNTLQFIVNLYIVKMTAHSLLHRPWAGRIGAWSIIGVWNLVTTSWRKRKIGWFVTT